MLGIRPVGSLGQMSKKVGLGLGPSPKVPAQVATSVLTALEQELTDFEAWRSIQWNAGPTKDDGLAQLLATIAATSGLLGVDFGNTTPEASLAAGSTHPNWYGVSNLIPINLYNSDGNQALEGYDVDGQVVVGAMDADALIRNCVIRGLPGSLPIYTIAQEQPDGGFRLDIEDCLIQGASAANISMGKGYVKRTYIYESGGFGIAFTGSEGHVDECFIRKMCLTVGAHGECMFIGKATDFKATRNTLYVPDGALPLGEGATGVNTGITACIYLAPGPGGEVQTIDSAFIAGNLCAGGAYALYYGGGSNSLTQNVCTVNNVVASGPDYTSLGTITMTGAVGHAQRNMLFYGNIDENGVPLLVNGVDANGIWDFDKAYMDARTRYVGQKVGYLDSNGDCKPEWLRGA